MCSLQKISKQISDHSLFHGVSQNNTLRRIIAPGSERVTDVGQGKGSFESVVDPSNFTQPSIPQKNAAAWAAGAPQRAADAALNDANTSLASMRARRRAGSALATGATGGDGTLSSVLAYGKSTFG